MRIIPRYIYFSCPPYHIRFSNLPKNHWTEQNDGASFREKSLKIVALRIEKHHKTDCKPYGSRFDEHTSAWGLGCLHAFDCGFFFIFYFGMTQGIAKFKYIDRLGLLLLQIYLNDKFSCLLAVKLIIGATLENCV